MTLTALRVACLSAVVLFSAEASPQLPEIQLDFGTKGGKCAGINLDKSLEKWGTILRMGDWDIDIRCGMPDNLDKIGYIGYTIYNPITKRGVMFINPSPKMKGDRDTVVLHELIHPLIGNFKASNSEFVEEQLVQLLVPLVAGNKQSDTNPCPETPLHKQAEER